jgi:uncharacterized surface protein with fasciclin (FAS1) repeats
MKSFKAMLAISVLSLAAVSLQAQDKDIVDTAIAAGNFTTLVKAVQAAGLVDTLKGAGPFTVFAPTDEAFAKLPPGALDALIANPAKLKEVLLYHVVPGKVMAAEVKPGVDKTAEGAAVKITVKDGKVFVNRAQVIKTDIVCSNGVIHVIDAVLMPKMPDHTKM